jgi:hypothetical protein
MFLGIRLISERCVRRLDRRAYLIDHPAPEGRIFQPNRERPFTALDGRAVIVSCFRRLAIGMRQPRLRHGARGDDLKVVPYALTRSRPTRSTSR